MFHRINRLIRISSDAATKAAHLHMKLTPLHCGFLEAQEPIVHQVNPPLCEHSSREQANLQLTREGRSLNSMLRPSYFPLAVFLGALFRVNIHSLFCYVLLSTHQCPLAAESSYLSRWAVPDRAATLKNHKCRNCWRIRTKQKMIDSP